MRETKRKNPLDRKTNVEKTLILSRGEANYYIGESKIRFS